MVVRQSALSPNAEHPTQKLSLLQARLTQEALNPWSIHNRPKGFFQFIQRVQLNFSTCFTWGRKTIHLVEFSKSVCRLIDTWIISGLNGLSLQVIYTPVRLSGFYKAFYVQINSLIGAKPSHRVSSWSEVLRTLRWGVMETGRMIMFLLSLLWGGGWLECDLQKAATHYFFSLCAIFNMPVKKVQDLQSRLKAQNEVTFTNCIYLNVEL